MFLMRKKAFWRAAGVFLSSLASVFGVHSVHAKAPDGKDSSKSAKKLRAGQMWNTGSTASATEPGALNDPPKKRPVRQYPWKFGIVTTTFWIGERPTRNNPVPNHKSSWDANWVRNYGGTDTPNRNERTRFYTPAGFTPRQNPFYVALPYNDMTASGHKAEASQVIPWFEEAYENPHKSVCKGRWVAIRKGSRVCYAQWEDAGPFRTDYWQYVFGNERPKPNLNKGAGLDVSPAVRDFLGMEDTDVTDWKFVEFEEVPHGPWAQFGDNNTFVINRRANEERQIAASNETEGAGRRK
jgi:hypothetical protein